MSGEDSSSTLPLPENKKAHLCLVPHSGSRFKAPIYIFKDLFTFGRKETCSFQILDQRLSAIHCKLEIKLASGEVYLTDMSSNGTYLNREIIGKGKRVQLLDGDSLDLLISGEAVSESESIGFKAQIKNKENELIKELEQSVLN